MTTDPTDDKAEVAFNVPELSQLDDGSIRRAVRRGIVLTGLVAAAWLLLAGVLGCATLLVVNATRTAHFHEVAFNGAQVGRPGYVVTGNGCCSDNVGLTLTQHLEMHLRGGTAVDGQVRLSLTGGYDTVLPAEDASPVGVALHRQRPTKQGTTAFLASLPRSVSASAIVEFTTPLDQAGLDDFRFGDRPYHVSALLLTDPYDGPVVSWQQQPLTAFTTWVGKLSDGDDEALDALGAPPVDVLRAVAKDPHIQAVVLELATVDDLKTLLTNSRIRSVNVAEVVFDPARQNLDN